MVKRKRHSPEQIIRKLREAERLKSDGKTVGAICQALAISEQTYHRWRNAYGGMTDNEIRRLKALEEENRRLKKLVADQALDNQILREVAEGIGDLRSTNGRPFAPPPGRRACARDGRRAGAKGLHNAASAAFDSALSAP